MHINKGKTIAQCLKARVDYIENPEKTNGGELISSYACSPETADQEFLLARNEYMAITGRRIHNEVIAYQLRQSFKPGEVTPEEANRIGYELASRFLKGEHAFLVATHNDRRHVHNHIVFCATALDCTHKFRDILRSGKALAELSDQICTEHNLSVITEPKSKDQSYDPELVTKGEITARDTLRMSIDAALRMRPDRIIVGEVRGEETVDMISSAMLNGHSGSMSTGHANNPADMLHRFETMMMMGIDLPLTAIQRQVASALDIIIHLGRLRDKTRKVLQITEILGYEEGKIQMQTLYEFQEEGMKNGKIQGFLMKKNEITNKEKLLAAGYHTN